MDMFLKQERKEVYKVLIISIIPSSHGGTNGDDIIRGTQTNRIVENNNKNINIFCHFLLFFTLNYKRKTQKSGKKSKYNFFKD